MTVIRKKHNRENPYVQINKKALWNDKLSLKAIGLWARCMSRPDDWRFNISEMAENGKEGKRCIYTCIDELIEQNYAIRLEHWEKSEDGKFTNGGVEYIFFEFPATEQDKIECLEEFKKTFRNCGFGNSRGGSSQNAPLLNTENTEKEVTNSFSTKQDSESKFENVHNSKKVVKNMQGVSYEVTKDEIFTKSIQQRKDWKSEEIEVAWNILLKYNGIIDDAFAFICGTIKKIRNPIEQEKVKTQEQPKKKYEIAEHSEEFKAFAAKYSVGVRK